MNGKQLKNSILQWAIQGKLVPQDPNDEPASVLLEKIRAEKARLVKEGKLKKKDLEVMPIEEDEVPFEVPESWKWMRLGDIVSNQTGLSYSKGDLEKKVDNPIRVLRGGNIQNGAWSIKVDDVMIAPEFVNKQNLALQKNTFITPAVTSLEHLGKTALIENDHSDIVAGGFVLYLLPFYREDTFVKYLSHFFQSSFYNKYCKSIANKSGQAFWNISRKKLMNLTIPLPPLAEQHRIVAKIEELMPLVEKYGETQETLEEWNNSLPEKLKKSILQEAIQGKLVPQDPADEPASVLLEKIRVEKTRLVKEGKLKKKDLEVKPIEEDEVPFDIPESWEWCIIGDLFAHNNGKQLNKGNAHGEMMDYITTSNLYWEGFVLNKLKQMPFKDNEIDRCQAIKGDLLVCEGGDIGRAAIWNYDYPIMLQNHLHKLRAYVPLCTEYFRFLFYYYNKSGMIGGKGIGIQGFSSKALHNTLVPLPTLSEQKRIVAKVEELFEVMKKSGK